MMACVLLAQTGPYAIRLSQIPNQMFEFAGATWKSRAPYMRVTAFAICDFSLSSVAN